MLNSGCNHIIVVDVAADDNTDFTNYGKTLNGWSVLLSRLNPFRESIKVLSQSEIQARLAFCSHNKNLKELKKNPNYEYVQLPVGHFSPADFGKIEEMRVAGYNHGTTLFAGLRQANLAYQGKEGPWQWLPASLDHNSHRLAVSGNRIEQLFYGISNGFHCYSGYLLLNLF